MEVESSGQTDSTGRMRPDANLKMETARYNQLSCFSRSTGGFRKWHYFAGLVLERDRRIRIQPRNEWQSNKLRG